MDPQSPRLATHYPAPGWGNNRHVSLRKIKKEIWTMVYVALVRNDLFYTKWVMRGQMVNEKNKKALYKQIHK